MRFEWDKNKNQKNIQKNKLDFEDAKQLFTNDTLYVTVEIEKIMEKFATVVWVT